MSHYSSPFEGVVCGNLNYTELTVLFAAFDTPHYQKLLSVCEVLMLPQEVIDNVGKGAFVCSINGNSMHRHW